MKRYGFGKAQCWLLVWFPPLLAGAVYLVQTVVGAQTRWWQLWLVALFITVAGILVRGLRVEDVDESIPVHTVRSNGLIDKPFAEVTRWENRLSWGHNDVKRFNTAVRPRIKELANERLQLRHGIDCRSHPSQARQLLGNDVFQFLNRSARSVPNPRQWSVVIHTIEEI